MGRREVMRRSRGRRQQRRSTGAAARPRVYE